MTITNDALEVALEVLINRVRWYELRGYAVPDRTAAAFNEFANALEKPNVRPWTRIRIKVQP